MTKVQTKASKKSRAANSLERQHMQWIKERMICAACSRQEPVICHHMYGQMTKAKVDFVTVQIGHAAVLGVCQECDNIVTHGSRRAFTDAFGPQNKLWQAQYASWTNTFPEEVEKGIMNYE